MITKNIDVYCNKRTRVIFSMDIDINTSAINGNAPIEILLAEDNLGDVFLAKKAFSNSKIKNNITVANDGEHLLSILNKADQNGTKVPDLILLDLNMPKVNGKQALAEIKKDDKLKKIPVIILSSSKSEQDIAESYDLHANSYLVKPVSLEQYKNLVKSIENFWLSTSVLPIQ